MKVCLVGHHVSSPDEGVRNVTHHLSRELAKQHQVTKINIWNLKEWTQVSLQHPDIIHFILGPSSFLSLVAAKSLSLLYKPAKTVMSAIQPFSPRFTKWMLPFKPDVMLVQSHTAERLFSNAGCKVTILPNGVDTNKFVPVSIHRKVALREKYHLPDDKYVILHVGAINRGRNVHSLISLQNEHRQVVIIGRPSEASDQNVLEQLEQRGCLVWTDYFAELEEIYGLSDCYVFPCISNRHSIELPLSVLEAMACNLPVVSRYFGALPETFSEDASMVFAKDDKTLIHKVCEMNGGKIAATTRQKVLPYSWDSIAQKITMIYEELI